MKIAINGFGRIGRCITRSLVKRNDTSLELVAVNDLTDASTLAHLFKYDSVHGRFDGEVKVDGDKLVVDGKPIAVTAEKDPEKLPWKAHGVELVIECTGIFRDKAKAGKHITAGAKKVLLSAPGKEVDATFCYGVNHEVFDPAQHDIVSNASCTTNCLAPVVKALDDAFGVEHGLMTTIHAVTNDQRILDLPHSDLRRARAAFESMIPTSTGAAKAVGLVLPHLAGKLNGFAVRVPTRNVSLVDFTAQLKKDATKDQVNDVMRTAANGPMKGVLGVSDEELVSIDYNGIENSSTVDLALTEVMAGRMAKVVSWYDNEWAYSVRCIDVANYMARKMS
ncbi:MAG: type I glyceraldehyde-3-phosphate dehydrogenase [Myxococcota bacterium]